MTKVYADYAAAAPLRPAARAALLEALAHAGGNPSSIHWAGAAARARLEAAREAVAAAIGAHPLEIVFTSGATEANNLALAGAAATASRIAVLATEHSSVLMPARARAQAGCAVAVVPVTPSGVVTPDAVDETAADLLTLALVNAETGIMQPCAALADVVHARGGLVHVDAAQAPAVLPLDVDHLGADLLTLSSLKVGGGAGAGVLYVRRGTAMAPRQHGGSQEWGLRAGTENVPAIAAFAAALAIAAAQARDEYGRLGALTARLRAGIAAIAPDAQVAGDPGARAPHIVNVRIPGIHGESVVAALDLEGVAASAGSACAAGATEPSHVLLAMGCDRAEAASALRFSAGWGSSESDVDRIVAALATVLARARRGGESWAAHAS